MLKRIAYYVDYVAYPVFALAAIWADPRFILVALGAIGFTLAEYWIHRTALHRWFYHGTHEQHHLHPEEYTVIWYIPLIFLFAYGLLPLSVFGGFTLGYVWFISMHHLLHHVERRPRWLERYAVWHDLHHTCIRYNFGITHPLWDIIFGTYRLPPRGAVR